MPQRHKLARPVMCAATGLHADHTGRQQSDKFYQLVTSDLLAQNLLALLVDAIQVKHILCQINSQYRYHICCSIIAHGRLAPCE